VNYRDYIARLVRGIPTLNGSYGPYGFRFVSILFGLGPDILAAGLSAVVRSPWTSLGKQQPDDALALLASERDLERYPKERSWADDAKTIGVFGTESHRTRIRRAWQTYAYAGTALSLVEHLYSAGYWAVIHEPGAQPASPYFELTDRSWPLQFAVIFSVPSESPITGGPKTWGSFGMGGTADFKWGDGTMWGVQGDKNEIALIRSIVRKRKPVQWKCIWLVFLTNDLPVKLKA
jgi:Phage tail protein (Tail_P2_I)